jgi:hypothetical protein
MLHPARVNAMLLTLEANECTSMALQLRQRKCCRSRRIDDKVRRWHGDRRARVIGMVSLVGLNQRNKVRSLLVQFVQVVLRGSGFLDEPRIAALVTFALLQVHVESGGAGQSSSEGWVGMGKWESGKVGKWESGSAVVPILSLGLVALLGPCRRLRLRPISHRRADEGRRRGR